MIIGDDFFEVTPKTVEEPTKELTDPLIIESETWTINLHENGSQRTKKTLVDTFKALHIDIAPLGHYEMIIDYWSNGISVSETKGHQPKLVS